jgi:cobalt-zinc-cadmium efflux system protein
MAGDHDDHGHSHGSGGHTGHAHGVSADADAGKLSIALALILGFMAVEVAVGIIAHSLALLSDPGHMLTDAAAIAHTRAASAPIVSARPRGREVGAAAYARSSAGAAAVWSRGMLRSQS